MGYIRKFITKRTVLEMTGFDDASLYKAIETRGFPVPAYTNKTELWRFLDVVDWVIEEALAIKELRKRFEGKT